MATLFLPLSKNVSCTSTPQGKQLCQISWELVKNWGSSSRRKIGNPPPDRQTDRPPARHADSYIIPPYTLRVYILTLIGPGGGGGGGRNPPPLDISRDISATRKALAATFYDFFLSSIAQLLRPNLARPRIPFLSHAPLKKNCQPQNRWILWFCVQIQYKLCFFN